MVKKLFFIVYGLLVFSCSQGETTMSVNSREFNSAIAGQETTITINSNFIELCLSSNGEGSVVSSGQLSQWPNQLLRI